MYGRIPPGYALCPDKLDVVYKKHVNVPVFIPELLVGIVFYGIDKLIREPLRRNVENSQVLVIPGYIVADGMHQVRLPQADAP